MSYFNNKRGEIKELENSLMDPRVEVKMQAIRQVHVISDLYAF